MQRPQGDEVSLPSCNVNVVRLVEGVGRQFCVKGSLEENMGKNINEMIIMRCVSIC